MSGSTQGERKLNSPAVNEIATPSDTPSIPFSEARGTSAGGARRRLLRWYYGLKYRAFRGERRPRDGRRGLVVIQIDALAYPELRRAIELGYCPTIGRMVRQEDYVLRRWFCGLPAATPYCQ